MICSERECDVRPIGMRCIPHRRRKTVSREVRVDPDLGIGAALDPLPRDSAGAKFK